MRSAMARLAIGVAINADVSQYISIDFIEAEWVPCTKTYPFASLHKGHAPQILQQHK